MKIVCVGQSAYDITLPISGYPKENKKYKIDGIVECGGGSSNNAAYLLGLWGSEVYLASSIGKDEYGQKIKKELVKGGVHLDYLEEINERTVVSYIINNIDNGSRTIITNKNPLMHVKNGKNTNIKADIILLDGNEYDLACEIIKNNSGGIKIIDAGSLKEETIKLCKECDYIVCSNDFLKDYTKIDFQYTEKDKIKEAYNLLQKDFKGKVVVTLEAMGSLTKISDKFYLVPSIKVKSVDSTGAGDIYHGAFTYFISEGYSLLETLHYSNIAGALSVTKIGSKQSMPTLSEVINYHEL